MIKAIFFDIDGTLVSFKTHKVPQSTINALQILRDKNIKVFIASGRHLHAINNLGSLEFDGYITLNGGYCIAGNQKVIYKHSIPQEDIHSLTAYMQKNENFPCIFVHEQESYLNYNNAHTHEIFELLNFPEPPIRALHEAATGENFQLVAFFTKEQEEQIMTVMPHCEATRWNPLFTDVIPTGSSKQVGMDKILEYFNIPLEATMAFGDGGNDISMLQHAGISIAMGNASEQVKQAAQYVTAPIDEDGIAKALKHFGII